MARTTLTVARPFLLRWDKQAAHSAQRYLTQSTAVRDRIRLVYGMEAEVLPAPFTLGTGDGIAVPGVEPGFLLCVSRLLPYKNVGAVIDAFKELPNHRLVLVGTGPEQKRLRKEAPGNVQLVGVVSDQQLRWLYANCCGLVAASFEDYGLTPLEAAAHGKPTAALRWGGYLDTVRDGETGIFFDEASAGAIRDAVRRLLIQPFRPTTIRAHAAMYSEETFIQRLKAIVAGDGRPERRLLARVS